MVGLRVGALLPVLALVAGCAVSVTGTAVWPGDIIERVILTQNDFPPGVKYERREKPDAASPSRPNPYTMRSVPEGCADGMTAVVREAAAAGLGRDSDYSVWYQNARFSIGVHTRPLDLERVAEVAERCARYRAFFGAENSDGLDITTTPIDSPRPGGLAYRQTLGSSNPVYMYFENVGSMSVSAMMLPLGDDRVSVSAELPQTFLEVAARQAERVGSS